VIYLTTAHNDRDLPGLFESHAMGLSRPVSLPHGDFMFYGVWTGGTGIRICGDRKKLGDLIKCLNDGRHIQQIQSANEAGFDFQFLLTEGIWRPSPDTGLIQVRKGKSWEDFIPNTEFHLLEAYINQLSWYGGITHLHASSPRETVAKVVSLYLMFQKAPEDHDTLKKIYTEAPPSPGRNRPGAALLSRRPSLCLRIAKELPDIGWKRGHAVDAHFKGSVRGMVNASVSEWTEIDGIGMKTAKKVSEEMR